MAYLMAYSMKLISFSLKPGYDHTSTAAIWPVALLLEYEKIASNIWDNYCSASRSPPGQDPKQCHFLEFFSTWDSLLALWEPFWKHFCNLGITFGALLSTCLE